MLIKAYNSGSWQISIYTNNTFCQTSEVLVDVTVKRWASKTCYQCKGPYDIDWLQWIDGLVLDSNGSWLPKTNKIPSSNSGIYWIWGMITMIITLFYLALSLIYGRVMLEPILHLQTFIIYATLTFILSDNTDVNLQEYLSWIQFAKLDLWYLNYGIFERPFLWTPSSYELRSLYFDWQETIVNYINLWVLMIMYLILRKLLLYISNNYLNKWFEYYYVSSHTLFWIIWHLIHSYAKNLTPCEKDTLSNFLHSSKLNLNVFMFEEYDTRYLFFFII